MGNSLLRIVLKYQHLVRLLNIHNRSRQYSCLVKDCILYRNQNSFNKNCFLELLAIRLDNLFKHKVSFHLLWILLHSPINICHSITRNLLSITCMNFHHTPCIRSDNFRKYFTLSMYFQGMVVHMILIINY